MFLSFSLTFKNYRTSLNSPLSISWVSLTTTVVGGLVTASGYFADDGNYAAYDSTCCMPIENRLRKTLYHSVCWLFSFRVRREFSRLTNFSDGTCSSRARRECISNREREKPHGLADMLACVFFVFTCCSKRIPPIERVVYIYATSVFFIVNLT